MSVTEPGAETAWSLEVDADQIGWLSLDRPGGSANTLSRAVLLGTGAAR